MESVRCRECGIGEPAGRESCPWCGREAGGERAVILPWRAAFWDRFSALPGMRAASSRGPLVLGAAAGGYAGLLLSLISHALPLRELVSAGFVTSWQWWWNLLPDVLQQPAIAVTRGALLGVAVSAVRWEILARVAGSERVFRSATGAWLGAGYIGVLAWLFEGGNVEGLAVAAVGGAFIGAAVDHSRARWLARPRSAGSPGA